MPHWRDSYNKNTGEYDILPYTSQFNEADLWKAIKEERKQKEINNEEETA